MRNGGANTANERYDGIDALRAFCCVGLAAMHLGANTQYAVSGFFFDVLLPLCTEFVYLFMMISAFGNCCGYYKKFHTNTADIESFYSKRYRKLLPYFGCLVILDVILKHSAAGIMEGLTELTLVFGLLPNNSLDVIGVGWFMGLVFLFYMLFPFVVYLLGNKLRAWLAFCASIAIHIFCEQWFFTERFVVPWFVPYRSPLFCAPWFLGGGLIYIYRRRIVRFVNKYPVQFALATIAATVLGAITPGMIGNYNFSQEKALVLDMLWLSLCISIKSPILINRVTRFLSDISFEIYLTHMVIFRVMEKTGILYLFGDQWYSYFISVAVMLAGTILFIQGYRLAVKQLPTLWNRVKAKYE